MHRIKVKKKRSFKIERLRNRWSLCYQKKKRKRNKIILKKRKSKKRISA